MKKIEKINNQITELREEQSKVYMEAMKKAKETLIEKFLKPQGVYFNLGDNEFKVRPNLGYTSYNSKLEEKFIPFEIIFNNNNWNTVNFDNIADYKAKAKGEFKLGVEFNIHSRYGNGEMITNGDNLKQLAFFGLVAQCIEDTKEEIASTMTDIMMSFEYTYNTLGKAILTQEMHIRVIREEEKEKAQKNLIKKLTTTGIDIKEDAHNFEYGYKKTIWAPTHIKITKKSASGKSATIEVGSNDFGGVNKTFTYDRVRVENIVDFVECYQK
tara:strand:+ start:730 stop:1539 length:810 start_codon:yes stop_codon:yes gene_type:complete